MRFLYSTDSCTAESSMLYATERERVRVERNNVLNLTSSNVSRFQIGYISEDSVSVSDSVLVCEKS